MYGMELNLKRERIRTSRTSRKKCPIGGLRGLPYRVECPRSPRNARNPNIKHYE